MRKQLAALATRHHDGVTDRTTVGAVEDAAGGATTPRAGGDPAIPRRARRPAALGRSGHHLRRALASYRVRVVAWFVLVLAVGTAATVAVVGEVLLQGVDERIRADLTQETEEFGQLAGGNDPETGQPFADDVGRIFDVFLERNIPGRNEVFMTFLDGQLYRTSHREPAYALETDQAFTALVAGGEASTRGRYMTPLGAVEYLALPVRVDDAPRGVFAVASFRDLERRTNESVVGAVTSVGVVLLIIGSFLAWRLADRVLAPVRRTAATARAISESDLTQRVDVRGDDEVAQLARTFNAMLDRISTAFEGQRRFMDDVGHELRTPLTIVRGHLELIDEGPPEERERTRELVLDELDRMTRIVSDLLVLAASSRPDFIRRDAVDAAGLARSVHEKARVLGERDWRLELARPGSVSCDAHRVTQAMLQLAENAVRYTEAGTAIHVGADVGPKSARFWVRDEGRGIPDDEQAAIFRRFYRLPGESRSTGTGLGLSIVRAIAEAHGGRAEVSSRLGSGSTFTIEIPVDEQPPQVVRP